MGCLIIIIIILKNLKKNIHPEYSAVYCYNECKTEIDMRVKLCTMMHFQVKQVCPFLFSDSFFEKLVNTNNTNSKIDTTNNSNNNNVMTEKQNTGLSYIIYTVMCKLLAV